MSRLFVATASLLILFAGSAAAQTGSHDTKYRLGVGDQVRLKVFEWRNAVGEVHEWSALNSDFRVGPDGSLSLPLLGAVAATGHTVDELADAISKSLQGIVGLALTPQASVEVVQFRPFYILGSVNHPGEYTYRPGMTLLQAISIAGGLHRVDDPSLLMFQRNSLTTAGDLRVSQLDYNGFLARRARLQAELDGSDKIAFPPDLLRQQNDPVVAQLMQREQVMFVARRDALRSQLDALNSLKDLLSGEVASLQAKIKNADEEIAMLKGERTNTTNLVRQGLAVAPREFTLRQAEVQTQGRRLDLDTAVLRAREDIGKADQSLLELRNKFRNDILTELADVERRLSEAAARIKTNQMIVEREITEPELASMLSEAHGELAYSIIRGTGSEAREMPASETSIVEPGDTVRVKRNTETSAQYSPAVGNSADPGAEAPAKAALQPSDRRSAEISHCETGHRVSGSVISASPIPESPDLSDRHVLVNGVLKEPRIFIRVLGWLAERQRAWEAFPLRIAIGIATIGRSRLLRASLDELARQLRPPERIVVCAPCADDIGAATGDAKIEVLLGPHGLTRQRNAILDQVRDCDVVVFFDDDFLPTPSYLEVVERVFTACPDVVMTTGLVIADGIIGPGISLEEARSWLAVFATITRNWRDLEEVTNGYGCNMAMRVAAVEAAHCRFDEKLPLYGWLEDVDFGLQLAQRGRIVKALAAQGVHLGIKEGRQSGMRLGYSQIANPIYLSRKGTLPWLRALRLISRNIAANLLRLMSPEPYIDRAGRASGNIKALRDLLSGSLTPERILEL